MCAYKYRYYISTIYIKHKILSYNNIRISNIEFYYVPGLPGYDELGLIDW